MATGSSDLTTFTTLLKTIYLQGVKDLINSKTTAFGRAKKAYREGLEMRRTLRTGRTHSLGAQAPGVALQTPQTVELKQPVIPPRYLYGTLEITEEIIEQARSDAGSTARSLTVALNGLATDMRDDLNRQWCNDGSGVLGVVSAVTLATGVVTLVEPTDVRKFGVGQLLNGFSVRTAGGTQRTSNAAASPIFLVEAVNPSAGTITLADPNGVNDLSLGTSDLAANDVLVKNGTRTLGTAGVNGSRFEIMGLDGAVSIKNPPLDDAGLFGIDRPLDFDGITANASGVNAWASYVNSAATSRPLTGPIMTSLIDGVHIKAGGVPDYFLTTFGIRAEYADLQGNVRRSVNRIQISGETSGGFAENVEGGEFLEYNNIPIIPEKYCTAGTVFLIGKDALGFDYWSDWHWLDRDGGVLKLSQQGGIKPSWIGVLAAFGEMGLSAPSQCAKATQIIGQDPLSG